VDQLGDSRFRADAASALVRAGRPAAEPLARALVDPSKSQPLRTRIVRLVRRLGGFSHREALWQAYENGRGQIRLDALSALSGLGHHAIDTDVPEPRSASVEAFEETRFFRLDRDTLFELMTDNIGVVSGIVQVLCQRLRRMTTIATGDKR